MRNAYRIIPPESLIAKVGPGDYVTIGYEFFHYLVAIGGLRPDAAVLEVGCGCGRMAVPLSRYIKSGSYEGFDVDREAITWCQENISPNHPNFRFRHLDIYNAHYNPTGKIKASELSFE